MTGGCHRIELLLNLLGPIAETAATKANVLAQREVEDTAVAVFRFARGTLGVLSMSHSIGEGHDSLDIYGSCGAIHAPVLKNGKLFLLIGERSVTEEHPPHPNSHVPLIESFCRSVLDDENPVVGGRIGMEVQLVEDAVYPKKRRQSPGSQGPGPGV